MRKKKTDKQKESDRKGKERMSYYLRKKLEREQAEAPPEAEDGIKQIECWQKKDGEDWKKIYYPLKTK